VRSAWKISQVLQCLFKLLAEQAPLITVPSRSVTRIGYCNTMVMRSPGPSGQALLTVLSITDSFCRALLKNWRGEAF
jgi:hypothetical protein